VSTISVVFDFDSTLATTHVGGEMLRGHTGGIYEDETAEVHQRYRAGITTLHEYQEEGFNALDESISQASKRAADYAVIRPLAREVCEQVWISGGVVAVASAGLDIYIQSPLDKAGLGKIEVHAGMVTADPTGLPPFRYDYPSSFQDTCQSGGVFCKCGVINSVRRENGGVDAEVIFVGDGTVDQCAAANAADTVFATRRLLDYCNNNGIPATEFDEDFEPLLSYVLSKTSENGDR
jgi:2-hydroxy-3-keto-5-methylthiopentenyl-1-phosphate phosphatase